MARLSHTVEPSRLAYGAWCHASEKQIGEGDIRASYSADRIGMGQPIRKPFRYAGELWVCVGASPSGAEAYRLVDLLQAFQWQHVNLADPLAALAMLNVTTISR